MWLHLLPVGVCTNLTALSVVFTCWPPAPDDLNESTLRSLGFMSMLIYRNKESKHVIFLIYIDGYTNYMYNKFLNWTKGVRPVARAAKNLQRQKLLRPRVSVQVKRLNRHTCTSFGLGKTATWTVLVCTLSSFDVLGTRITLWTPPSYFNFL